MKSVVWIGVFLPLLFLSPALAQDGPPSLTGDWVLNEKMSDDFAEVMREAKGGGQERPQGGGGRGGGGGRRGGGDGGQKGGENGDRQAQAQERMERAQEEYSRLEIFHDGIELNVTNGLDISRLVYTDGREMNIWTQRGEAKATANWQGQFLVVEWKTNQDTTSRIRKYTLSDEGRLLYMHETLKLPGQDKTVDITMVYDLSQ